MRLREVALQWVGLACWHWVGMTLNCLPWGLEPGWVGWVQRMAASGIALWRLVVRWMEGG